MLYLYKHFITALNNKPWITSLCATIYLVAGILFQYSKTPIFLLLILPLILIKRKELFVALLFFAVGFLLHRFQINSHKATKIHGTLKGVVLDCATKKSRSFPFCCTIYGQIKQQNGSYLLYTKESLNLKPGDPVVVFAVKTSNSTSGDFGRYLKKEGIVGTIFAKKPRCKIIAQHKKQHFLLFLCFLKNNILKNIKTRLSSKTFNLFSSIFLGNRNECCAKYEKQRTGFKNWGISHILARSGLHLVIFIISLSVFLSIFQLNFYIQQVFRFALVLLYYMLSWPSTSFNRAFLFFILWELLTCLGLQKNYINLLNIVCIIILISNPVLLFFIEFQLSFLLTYALAFLLEANQGSNKHPKII